MFCFKIKKGGIRKYPASEYSDRVINLNRLEDRNYENKCKLIEKERQLALHAHNREVKRLESELETRQELLRTLYGQEKLKKFEEFPYKFVFKNHSYSELLNELGLLDKGPNYVMKEGLSRTHRNSAAAASAAAPQTTTTKDSQPEQPHTNESKKHQSQRRVDDNDDDDLVTGDNLIKLNRSKKIQSAHARLTNGLSASDQHITDENERHQSPDQLKRTHSNHSISNMKEYNTQPHDDDQDVITSTSVKFEHDSMDDLIKLPTISNETSESVRLDHRTLNYSSSSNDTQQTENHNHNSKPMASPDDNSFISSSPTLKKSSSFSFPKVNVQSTNQDHLSSSSLSSPRVETLPPLNKSPGLELKSYSKAANDQTVQVKITQINPCLPKQHPEQTTVSKQKPLPNKHKQLKKANSNKN